MSRDTMTISLPPEMVREVDKVRKHEHRTRSELVREALRTYFVRSYSPTPRELAAIMSRTVQVHLMFDWQRDRHGWQAHSAGLRRAL